MLAFARTVESPCRNCQYIDHSCLDVPQGSGADRGRVPVVAVEAGVFFCCPIVAGLSGRELLLRGGEVAGVVPGRDGLNGLLADWARLPGE